jgi:cytochrome c
MPSAARLLAGVLAALAVNAVEGAGPQAPGDPRAGEAVYSRCLACHALAYDRTGPRHCGLFGRRAGSVEGFAYSEAMKRSKLVWDDKTLDRLRASRTRRNARTCSPTCERPTARRSAPGK